MKTICRSFRLLMFMGAMLLCACHTTRNLTSDVTEQQNSQSTHHEQATTNRLDSLISNLSASADSICIELYGDSPVSAPAQADSLAPEQRAQVQPASAKPAPKARITIHSPRINKEEKQGSKCFSQTNVADSTRSNSQSHTSTNDSKEVIGGAEPPNLTWVFIVLGLGITLLIIGAIFGYLWLHKKHII